MKTNSKHIIYLNIWICLSHTFSINRIICIIPMPGIVSSNVRWYTKTGREIDWKNLLIYFTNSGWVTNQEILKQYFWDQKWDLWRYFWDQKWDLWRYFWDKKRHLWPKRENPQIYISPNQFYPRSLDQPHGLWSKIE